MTSPSSITSMMLLRSIALYRAKGSDGIDQGIMHVIGTEIKDDVILGIESKCQCFPLKTRFSA